MVSRALYAGGLLLMIGAVGVVMSASTPPVGVPEISGSTLSTGLAALAGGVMIVRSRWGR